MYLCLCSQLHALRVRVDSQAFARGSKLVEVLQLFLSRVHLSDLKLAFLSLESFPKTSWRSSTSMGLTCVIHMDGYLNVYVALRVGS